MTMGDLLPKSWVMLVPLLQLPKYSETGLTWAKSERTSKRNGWHILLGARVLLPKHMGHFVIQEPNNNTHLGKIAMAELLGCYFNISRLWTCVPQWPVNVWHANNNRFLSTVWTNRDPSFLKTLKCISPRSSLWLETKSICWCLFAPTQVG